MTRLRTILDGCGVVLATALALVSATLEAADSAASGTEVAASAAAENAAAASATGASAPSSDAKDAGTAATAPIVAAVTQQPRPFGYLVGDVISQRVLLEAKGRPVEPVALPPPARLGAWFERRDSQVETASDGRRWLVVDYQLINAPTAVATVRLASWDLAGRDVALRVPAWEVSVAPLVGASSAPTVLQPDRPAPLREVAGERRRLLAWSATLIAGLLAWAGWIAWRETQARRSQPFAQALHQLRRRSDPDDAGARRILHGAFDRTAAEVMRTASLPRLFDRAPHLAPLRERIERFYAQSEAYFFAGRLPADAEAARGSASEATTSFCQDLRRLERGAER